MKVLILGATGMLGHKLYQVFSATFDVVATIRRECADLSRYGFFRESTIVPGVDVLDVTALERVIDGIKPTAIVNCVGII
ncbi:MAG: sugar nucleotide-binding protein, partial [Chloroflexi bacterium]|nr:sugar nucleotide-binding protein [Chloroflexota bacterium]